MCNRRNKPIFQGAVLLALVGGLGYTFYLHNLTKIDLEISRSETERYLKQQESLSSQLQVVYEHRARLERSLQKEKTDHKNTKLEFSKKQNDFLLNVTRSKHEAMNRFNSLETQYNMLKAQAKELDTDYNRLQQQYSRVSSEHSEVNKQQRRNFQLYKEQKTNEIASLDEEIKTLKQQVVSLRTHLKSKTEEAEQYKITSSRALAASQKYQEMLSTLQDQLSNYREKLKSYASQSKTDKAASREAKHDKKELGETRHQGHNISDSKMKRVVEQGEKVVPRQQKESPTGLSRGEGRHQIRPRRQVHVQITPPSDNDADQADMRRPPDEKVNEQRQVDENHSDESRDGIKANEGNIPLRDTNIRLADAQHGAKAISPTQSAVNKWADILQAAEQGQKVVGLKREDSNKEVKKEWKGESEEGRNRLNGDHKQEAAAGDNNQRQLGEEEVLDEQDGKPVEQAGHVADRPVEPGYQANNGPVAQIEKPVIQAGHLVDIPGEQEGEQDNQGYEFNEKNKDESHKEDKADDLSRENINKQVAEMQENYQQEQIKQQEKLEAVQSRVAPIPAVQRQVAPIPAVQRQVAPIPAVQRQVAPIPAVQRQVETAQEHRAKADADNDDEDADNDQVDDQDPDEDDPDDADQEDGDNFEAQDSRQEQQVHHDERTFDRSLKAAHDNKQQN